MYGDRRVYTVSGFAEGISSWLARLPALWVEGEVTEVRRQEGWSTVFVGLRDTSGDASLAATMRRTTFDRLELELQDGERVHVYGRPELYRARGLFQLRASRIERLGAGDLAATLERLRGTLAAEGLFDAERKRQLPRLPRRIAVVTGVNAAAKRDIISAVQARFPAAELLVAETTVQGPRAPEAIVGALQTVSARDRVDVVVLTRGGGSFEDLLPFSDERVVRAVASCRAPVVSAVGHEHDRPLCDLAADVRASTPTAAARFVVPDRGELIDHLDGLRARGRTSLLALAAAHRERLADAARRLARAPLVAVERARTSLDHQHHRGVTAARRAVSDRRDRTESLIARLRALSPEATLRRGYGIVRAGPHLVTSARDLGVGTGIDITLADSRLGARVTEVGSRSNADLLSPEGSDDRERPAR